MSALNNARRQTLDQFYHGAASKDLTAIRAALTDDFQFTSPLGNHDNPDSFAQSLLAFDGSVSGSRMIAEGDSVVHLFVLDIGTKIPMCDVISFNGDKIATMETYTDSKLFAPDASH